MNNIELIETYLDNVKKTGVSDSVFLAYKNDLDTLKDFLGENSIILMSKSSIMDYINFLRDNFTNNTVVRKLNSFKNFYKILAQEKKVDSGLLEDLKNFKQEFSIPEVLTEDELEMLFRACEPTEKGKRDILVIKLLLKTGMQLNGALELKTEDVTEESIAFEKNNKKYLVKVDEELKGFIVTYKNSSICGDKKLFDGLSRQNFFARVKKYQREAGIDREINPAMLRNTAMYSFIEEGTTMRELKERLDYVNIGMSGIYKIRNKSDIKKVYKKIGIGDWDVSEFN
ncbi:MAG: tyrosine-type recombinase/integrase [Fusobacteriaceae bacterium]|jgi:integrase/recombinase XerD|nr:tyrosine-type recombinase/integrase [Fusobacteriaceae bacterium]MBP6467006.1 tyrosine-type recombinase/integrase [Fusobacteriaceae bacterium]MBP9595799.1 tyrosine-type recombinase/integrase [Fusobacteriaceae bacterium]MBU9918126.1 tyrosine-type recombinase/integrase [Fusobacteriaceae bacterium]